MTNKPSPTPAEDAALRDIANGIPLIDAARRHGLDASDPERLRRQLVRLASLAAHPSARNGRGATARAALKQLKSSDPEPPSTP